MEMIAFAESILEFFPDACRYLRLYRWCYDRAMPEFLLGEHHVRTGEKRSYDEDREIGASAFKDKQVKEKSLHLFAHLSAKL